jgi:hypothetical protein
MSGANQTAAADLKGHRFGHLTVRSEMAREDTWAPRRWVCRCDCGVRVVASKERLRRSTDERPASCGCRRKGQRPMAERAATRRQCDVLDAIVRYTTAHGYPPSLRELADALSVASTNGVAEMLDSLVAKGFVRRHAFRARSLVVTEAALRVVGAGRAGAAGAVAGGAR